MSRKRDKLDQDLGTGPITKKIRSPVSTVGQRSQSNDGLISMNHMLASSRITEDSFKADSSFGIGSMSDSSRTSSSEICQNRKRRPRASREGSGSIKSIDDTMSFGSANGCNQTRKKSDLSCVVCCGLAHGYNFDAISCESCKAFFRRNALFNVDRLKCRRDGSCEITLETRRRCKSCRLKKCFAVGMRKEWILTEEEKLNKKRRIEENRRLRLTTNPDLSLSDDIPEDPPKPTKKHEIELQNVILEKSTETTSKSHSLLRNGDVIANVVAAFNDGFQMNPTSYGWSYPLAKKLTGIYQILNTKNTVALRLISFYKRLHEFDSLNEYDKVNLIRNNLPNIFLFHASLGYDPINDIYHEGIPSNETLVHGSDIREAHGSDIHQRCISIMRSLHSIVRLDKRIMQLALAVMLFTKHLTMMDIPKSLLREPLSVFKAQNFYVEHLWIFMEKYYGSVRTIQTFLTLTSKCSMIQALLRDIQHDISEKVEPEQVPPLIRTIMNIS